MIRFYGHPTCSTCRKARNWMQTRDIHAEGVNITETPPSRDSLAHILDNTDYTLRQLFNTSGQAYRDQNLKARLPGMSRDEALDLLASNGMLLKRPIVIDDAGRATVGFKEEQFEKVWGSGRGS
ncbi:MAG: arsenate reductase family protein [Phycisphaeraceae bacterium]